MKKQFTHDEQRAIESFIATRNVTHIDARTRAYTNAQMNDATMRVTIDTQMRCA